MSLQGAELQVAALRGIELALSASILKVDELKAMGSNDWRYIQGETNGFSSALRMLTNDATTCFDSAWATERQRRADEAGEVQHEHSPWSRGWPLIEAERLGNSTIPPIVNGIEMRD